jgi:hypothetical protein
LTGDLTEVAGSVVKRPETVQHGSESQLDCNGSSCDGACPDTPIPGIAIAMPCIGALFAGRQQSGEEVPSAQTLWAQVMDAKAG